MGQPVILPAPAGYSWGGMTTRSATNRVFLHCTATPEGRDVTFEDLWQWHVVDNGWSGPGYHYLIQLDGTIQACRPDDKQGAHASGHNSDSIGIAYAGGLEDDCKTARDTRTPEQTESMIWLIKDLFDRYSLSDTECIWGHNQVAAKACPSFDVPAWVASVVAARGEAGEPEPNMPEEPVWMLREKIRLLEDENAEFAQRINRLEQWAMSSTGIISPR